MADPNMGAGSGQVAAPAATPLAPPAAPPASAGQGGDGDVIRIPRQAIPGGDWHAVAADAKQYGALKPILERCQQAGMDQDQVNYLLEQYLDANAAQTVTAPGFDEGRLTELMGKVIDETIGPRLAATLQERDQQMQAEMTRLAATEAAQKARDDYIVGELEKLGYKPYNEDGSENPPGMMAWTYAQNELYRLQDSQKPQGLQGTQLEDYFNRPTQEHLQGLGEKLQWMKGYKYEQAAAVATEQGRVPGETLGDGPAGKQPAPDWENMSPEEQETAVMDGLDVPAD